MWKHLVTEYRVRYDTFFFSFPFFFSKILHFYVCSLIKSHSLNFCSVPSFMCELIFFFFFWKGFGFFFITFVVHSEPLTSPNLEPTIHPSNLLYTQQHHYSHHKCVCCRHQWQWHNGMEWHCHCHSMHWRQRNCATISNCV